MDTDLLIPSTQHLNDDAAIRRFKKYIGSVAHRHASVLDLTSPDVDVQMAGVAASYHIGRTDGRALILLRRLLFSLERTARRSAVWALASSVPHPDIFGSADGSPDPAAEALLQPTLRWTVVSRLPGPVHRGGSVRVRDPSHLSDRHWNLASRHRVESLVITSALQSLLSARPDVAMTRRTVHAIGSRQRRSTR